MESLMGSAACIIVLVLAGLWKPLVCMAWLPQTAKDPGRILSSSWSCFPQDGMKASGPMNLKKQDGRHGCASEQPLLKSTVYSDFREKAEFKERFDSYFHFAPATWTELCWRRETESSISHLVWARSFRSSLWALMCFTRLRLRLWELKSWWAIMQNWRRYKNKPKLIFAASAYLYIFYSNTVSTIFCEAAGEYRHRSRCVTRSQSIK